MLIRTRKTFLYNPAEKFPRSCPKILREKTENFNKVWFYHLSSKKKHVSSKGYFKHMLSCSDNTVETFAQKPKKN